MTDLDDIGRRGAEHDEPGSLHGESAAGPSGMSPIAAILAGLAVHGLDIDHAREVVAIRAARRLRRRHTVMACVAVVFGLALTVAVWPRHEPRKVVAADDNTSTTVTSEATSTTVAAVTTVPPSITSPPTTAPPVSITTVTTTIPTTTSTAVVVRPLAVTAQLHTGDATGPSTSAAVAGQTVTLRVQWSDPDLADPNAVSVHADFGDPLLALPVSSTTHPPCDTRGNGASGIVDVPFRYSTVDPALGRLDTKVRIEVTSCDGAGAYGKRVTLELPVTVTAPSVGQRIVVLAGAEGGRSPDAAEARTSVATYPPRSPDVGAVLAGDGINKATVVVVPSSFAGPMTLRWTTPTGVVCQTTRDPATIPPGSGTVRAMLGPSSTCPA